MTDEQKKITDLPIPESNEIRDALLGHDLDIDQETAESILESYDLQSDELVAGFKKVLQEELRKNVAEKGDEKERNNLVFFIKDIGIFQRETDSKTIEPESWINSIINNSNQNLYPNQFAYSYRRERGKEISDRDKKIIDDLQSELNKDQ